MSNCEFVRERERERERQIGRERKKHILKNKEKIKIYIFKWSGKKYRTFYVRCIIKWVVKINKITFWVAKS